MLLSRIVQLLCCLAGLYGIESKQALIILACSGEVCLQV